MILGPISFILKLWFMGTESLIYFHKDRNVKRMNYEVVFIGEQTDTHITA